MPLRPSLQGSLGFETFCFNDSDPRIVEVLSVAAEMKAAGTEGLIKTVPWHGHGMSRMRLDKVFEQIYQIGPDRCYTVLHVVPCRVTFDKSGLSPPQGAETGVDLGPWSAQSYRDRSSCIWRVSNRQSPGFAQLSTALQAFCWTTWV